jgi:hypothetical protein
VDLHPAGVEGHSDARDVFGDQQVGQVNSHASLWSGTAESWVDLHPAGASGSVAYGISGSQQVGNTYFSDIEHASLWSGTAESWVDLNPVGAMSSYASGVAGYRQVGWAKFDDGNSHASLWMGTAVSWVDLHVLLPEGVYVRSEAFAIDISGDEIWVVGRASNDTITHNTHAMLWHYTADPVPEPSGILALACGLGSLGLLRRRS